MKPIKIVHLYPDLLNLYGDGGNVLCLQRRCEWRNIPVEVQKVYQGDTVNLTDTDIVFIGGGPDREQTLAVGQLLKNQVAISEFVESNGVLLAICGGYQILGKNWLVAEEVLEGLALVDMETRRVEEGPDRLISDIVVKSPLCEMPVVGYENHAGRTFLGEGLEPFGTVISSVGKGNNDADKADGVLYKNLLGTYLHGPLLGKNPQVADCLLKKAFETREERGEAPYPLVSLDDSVERAANAYMCERLGV